ncbi:hypothetical protein V2G26_009582 [Clonostachys chloroleuca]
MRGRCEKSCHSRGAGQDEEISIQRLARKPHPTRSGCCTLQATAGLPETMENTMEATPSVLVMQRTSMMLVAWAEPKQHTRQGELIGRQSYTCYRRAECSEARF